MYNPQQPLFGRGPELTLTSTLYWREDGYVDLIVVIGARLSCDVVERTTYARITLEEATDVWQAQAELLGYDERPCWGR